MRVEIETITPEMAKVYLTANTKNRPLSQKRVAKYVSAMKSGEFNGMNGDSIRFDTDGVLIDGQKRLTAVVISGVPLNTLVIRGLDPEAFKTIDSQETRTAGQRFATQKEKNYNALASALSLLWKYKNRKFTGDKSASPTYQQMEDLLRNNDIRECTSRMISNASIKKLGSSAVPIFCSYAFAQANPDACHMFFEALVGDLPCSNKCPAFLLRERLQDNRAAKAKLQQYDIVAIWIKAFNHFQKGSEIKFLRWSSGAGEPFPEIDGYLPTDVK